MSLSRAISARRARTFDATASIHLLAFTIAKVILDAIGVALSPQRWGVFVGIVVADSLSAVLLLCLLGVISVGGCLWGGGLVPSSSWPSRRQVLRYPSLPSQLRQTKSEARDHRARVAQIILYAYLGGIIVGAMVVSADPGFKPTVKHMPEPVKGIMTVLVLHLIAILVYFVVRAFSPGSPLAAVRTLVVTGTILILANVATGIPLFVAERRLNSVSHHYSEGYYSSAPAVVSLVAAGLGGIIILFEGIYTVVHRGRAGFKTFFAAPVGEVEDVEMTPRGSDVTLKDEEASLEHK
ncbi:hypothetical protein CspHIS471_0611090 [Cutaneotrichosporon sp. HIS471]|nr:hypothetical protein CspHIS471_0611090 [Cutaneotrichosporon sp. HIS471]